MRIRFKAVSCAVTAVTALALVAIVPQASAATNLTWSGLSQREFWSTPGNWKGGVAAATDASLGTLTFGALGSSCDGLFGNSSCYFSTNDVAGLSVQTIDVDDNAPYSAAGGTISIGAGGIVGKAGVTPAGQVLGATSAALQLPFVLTTGQTWSVAGNGKGKSQSGLEVGSISGDYPLLIDLTHDAEFLTDGDIETGALTISGAGTVLPGANILNAMTSSTTTVQDGASLNFDAAGATAGPISLGSDATLDVARGTTPESTLAVSGALTAAAGSTLQLDIDAPRTRPSTDFSQLTATGNVTLAGKLNLVQRKTPAGCQNLQVHNVDTLLTTTGTLTGTFAGLPNGTTVKITNGCDDANRDATAVIRYSSSAVTATIKSPGDAGDVPTVTAKPKVVGKLRVGQTLTVQHGSWSHGPNSYKYAWALCSLFGKCKYIHGATHTTYALRAADVNHFLIVKVTARNKSGSASADAISQGLVARTKKKS